MITLFVLPSSASSRKAKAWFESNNIPFTERKIIHEKLTEDELNKILSLSLDGFEGIVSSRSFVTKRIISKIGSLERLTTNQLIKIIIDNPKMLKVPIILGENKVEVGFEEDSITSFLPRSVKNKNMSKILGGM